MDPANPAALHSPVSRHAAPPIRAVPLHLLLGGLVAAAMLALAAVLMWQGWQASRTALLQAARSNARDMGLVIDEKVRRMTEPAQATLRQLALDPITQATTLSQRMQRLRPLVQALAGDSLVSAVYVGYENGEFLLVRTLADPAMRAAFQAPPHADYLVQSITLDRTGQPAGRWAFFTGGLEPLGDQARPDYRFDPRTRPWYQDAKRTGRQGMSDAYVFFSSHQIGLTLSQPGGLGSAVVGMDTTLADLSREIADLRRTPRSEIAVIDADGRVIAYPDLDRSLHRVDGQERLARLGELGVPSLAALHALAPRVGEPVSYQSGGELWQGIVLNLDRLPGHALHILAAVPDSELLGGIREGLAHQGWLTLGLVLLSLPLGWLAGHQVSKGLTQLTRRAQQLTRFDFDTPGPGASIVREVKDLDAAFGAMCLTIQNFLLTTDMISREPRLDAMLDGVLRKLVETAQCHAGAVYLMDKDGNELVREAVCVEPGSSADLPMRLPANAPALVDAQAGRLTLQLIGRQNEALGMLVLHHAQDDLHQSEDFRAFAVNLSGALAVSVETRHLFASQQHLFNAVVQLLADAIDAKSPYTSGHCERVPKLAESMIDHLCAERTGPYAGFTMSDLERYEFRLAAWLHDCGKVTSPEHIIDKATKLETIYNRIHEVRTRFEILWRDAKIDHLERLARGADPTDALAALQQRQFALQRDFSFVAACNIGGESMTDTDIERLRAIGSQTWLRHFDDRLGLAPIELKRHHGAAAARLPALETLLADRAEHILPWDGRKPPVERGNPDNRWGFDMKLPDNAQNMGELYNLAIRRGTLTSEERFKINDHIVQTYIMLSNLPWPPHLARVSEIAATHHERLDGGGYPRKLGSDQLGLADRVMALADVFEALTAADRPYKPPKTLSQSLRIMAQMAVERHLDTDLFRHFLHHRLWEDFARTHLLPAQWDTVDVDAIDAMLSNAEEPA